MLCLSVWKHQTDIHKCFLSFSGCVCARYRPDIDYSVLPSYNFITLAFSWDCTVFALQLSERSGATRFLERLIFRCPFGAIQFTFILPSNLALTVEMSASCMDWWNSVVLDTLSFLCFMFVFALLSKSILLMFNFVLAAASAIVKRVIWGFSHFYRPFYCRFVMLWDV